MKPTYLTEKSINEFISLALAEDIGDGDHSSLASIPADAQNQARLLVKGEGILAGVELAGYIFSAVDPDLSVEVLLQDGAQVKYGDVALTVKGKAQSILTAERLVLNCMQRMSGIATYTRYLTSLIEGTGAKLLDTRKTTPNFRIMEKWAVLIGGGHNHRFGLFDMIILKDNHVDYAGGIREAIEATQRYLKEKGKDLKIEVETRNLDEVRQAIETGGIHRIMLDNMTPDMMREAVAMIGGEYETEASGGITEQTIRAVAECGVDYISVGALTHSIKSMDLSLKAY
ncbi:carboxylating nicotinate-nucleotide diphosphorylase [Pontibacter cellulosilyticus]|uniref:Probable nicotinate-nucleotide pyrophosphorylase [carboxylating] n=1 Tax=Pontibacter cellulosilyticus TaxID=1720253 RepID=A0A923N712_9BACT|nr:carboxylating nicotinate-nucleotide diphosphorylase [Pontibacter cellulosilyticus]MBC5994065.1 carboxylating nicotinate-nucleotide diphosphorylase [Pontibacter cellulosilyticus]